VEEAPMVKKGREQPNHNSPAQMISITAERIAVNRDSFFMF
jgi:hypothetical protein